MNNYIRLKSRIYASRVLLVEDEKIVLHEEYLFFKKFFSFVDTAESGAEGVDKFKRGNYEVVFADVKMPGMNGWEMVERIKKINHKVFVVMLSASRDYEDAQEHLYDMYLKKPLSFEDMIYIIKKIIKKFTP